MILLQSDPHADFRMRIFNADGSEAESCGNGLRCLGRFLLDLGFPPQSYRIRTHERFVKIDYPDHRIAISMGEIKDLKLNLETEYGIVHFLDTGVPHLVSFVPDVDAMDVANLGSQLRHHPLVEPKGANVNFATLLPDQSLRVRTYERGVERETLSCGTGACAVAFLAQTLFHLKSPISLQFRGGTLEVAIQNGQCELIATATRLT